MIERRKFIRVLALGLFAEPLTAGAQETRKIPRVGYLITASLDSPEARTMLDAFRQGLRERGYVEGRNIVIEIRPADGSVERFLNLAAELVALKVDVILAGSSPAARAAQQATHTIPIVVPIMGDPVEDGLVASLAKPGGNVTGTAFLGPTLVPKRLQLLKEVLPRASRVATLYHQGAYSERMMSEMLKEAQTEARTLGLQLEIVTVQGSHELNGAFSEITKEGADALLVFPSTIFFNERTRIVELAAKRRLPSIYFAQEFVQVGGVMSYGASVNDLIRRSATYVDKILKGAKPADLPVEQPTRFELVINLKAAKELGLTIPQSLLLRADEVIQ